MDHELDPVQVHVLRAVPAHPTAQIAHPGVRYTAQEIANRYPDLGKDGQALQEGAVRTRWFNWIKRVAPEPLLKDGDGFTQFAADLFDDFAQTVKRRGIKPQVWVTDAKARYAQEWESVGVIEGELMPPEVGSTLALAQNRVSTLTEQGEARKERLMKLIQQARSAESNLGQAQKTIAEQRGVNQALEEFEIELDAKLRTLSELRKALAE